jgi:hypothetical protein
MDKPLQLKVEVEPIEEMAKRSVEPFYRFRVTARDGRQEYTDQVIVSDVELLSRFDALFKVAKAAISAMIRRERGEGVIEQVPGGRWPMPPFPVNRKDHIEGHFDPPAPKKGEPPA